MTIMKTVFYIALFFLAAVVVANAQDTTSNPVKQGDPALRQDAEEIRRVNLRGMKSITLDEVPPALKKILTSKEYRGDRTMYYKHEEKDEYAVEVQRGEVMKFYLFDKNGKVVNRRN